MLKPEKFYDKKRLLARLNNKTEITEDGHWLWIGKTTHSGRGVMQVGGIKGRDIEVHRLSAFIHLGLNLKDTDSHALHKPSCFRRNCWNPNCLHVGTHADNMKDITLLPNFRCGHPKEGNSKIRSDGTKRCKLCHNTMNRNRRHNQPKTNTKTS